MYNGSSTERSVIRLWTLVHYSSALFSHISLLSLFSCCIFLTLCFFHVALHSCYTLFVAFWSSCIIVMLHIFHLLLFSCYTFLSVALFIYCTLFLLCFMLHSFHVAMCCVALVSWCTFSMLHFFYIALFSCCTFPCFTFFIWPYFRVGTIHKVLRLNMPNIWPPSLSPCSHFNKRVMSPKQ